MSDSSREVLGELLRGDGFTVSATGDDRESVVAHLAAKQPDVVILNLQHSDMRCVAFVRAALGAEARLVVVSALSHCGIASVQAGASEFFAKPLNYAELLRYLQATAPGSSADYV